MQRGDLAEAERLCQAVLVAKADHFDALYLLGIVAGRAGRPADAVLFMTRATALDPAARKPGYCCRSERTIGAGSSVARTVPGIRTRASSASPHRAIGRRWSAGWREKSPGVSADREDGTRARDAGL